MDRKGEGYANKLKEELLALGFDIDSDINQNPPLEITNFVYFRLLKLFPNLSDRRSKLLQFIGLSHLLNVPETLSLTNLSNFNRDFIKDRESAKKKKDRLEVFYNKLVVLPISKTPIADQERYIKDSDEPVHKKGRFSTSSIVVERISQGCQAVKEVSSQGCQAVKEVSSQGCQAVKEVTSQSCQTVIEKIDQGCQVNLASDTNLKRQLKYHKDKAEELKKTKKDLSSNLSSIFDDYELACDIVEERDETIEKLKEENARLKDELIECHNINAGLNEQGKSGEKVFDLKDKSGRIKLEVQACLGQLTTQCNVAQKKVPIVIRTVSGMFGIKVEGLPSRRTVGRSLDLVRGLNCQQAINVISNCSNFTLLSDETTKRLHKLQTFVINCQKNGETFTFFLGVSEVPNKSAARALEEFQTIIQSIATIGGLEKEEFFDNFVVKIRNLLSDKAATQNLFNKLFIDYRNSVIEKLPHLNEPQKDEVKRVNIFFCRLHCLNNSTQRVLNVFLEHEKLCTNNENLTVPTVLYIIKEFSRLFGKRSAAKHASAGMYETFAAEKKLTFYKIDSFLGHRFNIAYTIAQEILYNKEHLAEFIEKYGDGDKMPELKAALNNDLIILHLHILALIDALICGPMWRLSENSESILETGAHAIALVNFLKRVICNPMSFFLGESPFDAFPASLPTTQQGKEFSKVLKGLPAPPFATEIVTLVSTTLLSYFEKELEPFITGDFAFPDLALERETAGAPSNNRASEASFGLMDHLISTKPNMKPINLSITTLACKNKMFEWLDSLPEKEQEAALVKANDSKKVIAEIAKAKNEHLARELQTHLEKKGQEKAEKELQIRKDKNKVAALIEKYKFWRTPQAVDSAIEKLKKTEALKAVKANLLYRKIVWTPKFEQKWLFKYSHKNHTFTLNELVNNLKTLIAADFIQDENVIQEDDDEMEI